MDGGEAAGNVWKKGSRWERGFCLIIVKASVDTPLLCASTVLCVLSLMTVEEGSSGHRWESEHWIKMVRGAGEKTDEDPQGYLAWRARTQRFSQPQHLYLFSSV